MGVYLLPAWMAAPSHGRTRRQLPVPLLALILLSDIMMRRVGKSPHANAATAQQKADR